LSWKSFKFFEEVLIKNIRKFDNYIWLNRYCVIQKQ